LEHETDKARRDTLHRLLAEEEAKLKSLEAKSQAKKRG
jgi:hypothetical protein